MNTLLLDKVEWIERPINPLEIYLVYSSFFFIFLFFLTLLKLADNEAPTSFCHSPAALNNWKIRKGKKTVTLN